MPKLLKLPITLVKNERGDLCAMIEQIALMKTPTFDKQFDVGADISATLDIAEACGAGAETGER